MSSSTRLQFPAHARRWLLACLAACPAVAMAQGTPAVSTLVAFSGSQPASTPVRGPDGALYGASATTNVVTGGLIYRLAADGSKIDTIYQLRIEDGYSPFGGVVLGSDGRLYGTTSIGTASQANTSGTIYSLTTDGSGYTVLHRFADFTGLNANGNPINTNGANPDSELVEGSDGHLYGVTRTGGPNGTGVVFKIAKDGSGFAVLHAFGPITSAANTIPVTNADGFGLITPLVVYADGYVYGTATRGGTTGNGTIFRVRVDGTGFEVLHTFPALVASDTTAATNSDGAIPLAGLTDGGDGMLYGVASSGGSNGQGTLYVFDPVGRVFTVLHHFDGSKGSQPSGELLLGQDGRLYGTTASGGTNPSGNATLFGTVFVIARDGTGFTSLYSFAGSDGANPGGKLQQLDATTFVGMTQAGGRCSQGTAFLLSLTGSTVKGITNCGRRRNDSGGGAMAPALLLLLAAAGVARRLSTH